MIEVGSHKAQRTLPQLLTQVEQGEAVEISRRGRPVATLVAVKAKAFPRVEEALDRLQTLRRELRKRGVTLERVLTEADGRSRSEAHKGHRY